MAQAQDKLELALVLAEQRGIIAIDRRHDDQRHVSPERGLVRRVGRRDAAPLGLLDDAIRADVRARDKTHQCSGRDAATPTCLDPQEHCGPIGQHHVNERKHRAPLVARGRLVARSCRGPTGRDGRTARFAGRVKPLDYAYHGVPANTPSSELTGPLRTHGARIPMASRPSPPLCASPSHRQRDRLCCWRSSRCSHSAALVGLAPLRRDWSRATARCCGSPPTARRATS